MSDRILLGYDQFGSKLADALSDELRNNGYLVDVVEGSGEADYPDVAASACTRYGAGGHGSVILVCGTGLGMSIVANKFPGIRAARCTDLYSVERARRNSNANVLALAAELTPPAQARSLVRVWLTHHFDSLRSVAKLDRLRSIEEGLSAKRSL